MTLGREGGAGTPSLVVAAHGSADPRFGATVEAIAERLRARRPGIDVRVGYLEHGPPAVEDVVTPGAVVVPLLLASGFHARVDLPGRTPGGVITPALGPDPRLADVLADRLVAAGWDGGTPVTLVAAGSTDERALSDVRSAAAHLARLLGADVQVAFVSAGQPRLAAVDARVVASYLIAAGAFHDAATDCGADVVTAPIGDHPAVAEIVLDRYDAAVGAPAGPA